MKIQHLIPFSRSQILRRIAIPLAAFAWGGLAFGGGVENADVFPTNQTGPSAGAVVREPFTDKTEIALTTTFGGLAIQPDGKIVAGTGMWGSFFNPESGVFGRFGRGAFRFNLDGTLDRTFYCDVGINNSDASQDHVEINADGKILITGIFSAVDGKPRPGYALLNPDGSVDESFEPWRGRTNFPSVLPPQAAMTPVVARAAILEDGSIAAVRSETHDGPDAPYPATVYRLDPSGRWVSTTNTKLSAEYYQGIGGQSIPIQGLLESLGGAGFWARPWAVDWTGDTPNTSGKRMWKASDAAIILRALFDGNPLELCCYAVRMPDGGAVLSVTDQEPVYGSGAPGRIMRFDKNWKPDFSFSNHYENKVFFGLRIKGARDGKFLVTGVFGTMNGEDFPGLVRLDSNGQIDHSFHCSITYGTTNLGSVLDMAVQPDGRIMICGGFTAVNGEPVGKIARLNPDGSLDPTFKLPFISDAQYRNAVRGIKTAIPVALLSSLRTNQVSPASVGPPQSIPIPTLRAQAGAITIQFTGTPNQKYILQAKTLLTDANWVDISTNEATASGLEIFRDTDANKYPMRFYRIATQDN